MSKLPKIPVMIGTSLGVGFWPWGPGTAGALFGVIVWLAASWLLPSGALTWATLCGILAFTLLGTWATRRLEPYWGADPKRVVIDEVVGVWIPLLAVPEGNLWLVAASFLLFRFFDILKPLGIRAIDRREGAFFVMADDIVAGLYSMIIVFVLAQWAM